METTHLSQRGVLCCRLPRHKVPPSGGSLEIGNRKICSLVYFTIQRSPFGGIPRNWKLGNQTSPNKFTGSSPFGGIPRNWKQAATTESVAVAWCSPFGGIPRNWKHACSCTVRGKQVLVPPSGGSLEIGNRVSRSRIPCFILSVPPSGGSLEIGNWVIPRFVGPPGSCSPFGGIPRNWKQTGTGRLSTFFSSSPFGGIPRNWKLWKRAWT